MEVVIGEIIVKLQNNNGNMFGRDKFYIHGGFFKGSHVLILVIIK